MTICISISGTPLTSRRIWPMPIVLGAPGWLNTMAIWPDVETTPCMPWALVDDRPLMSKTALLWPAKTPLVALPSAHSSSSPWGFWGDLD